MNDPRNELREAWARVAPAVLVGALAVAAVRLVLRTPSLVPAHAPTGTSDEERERSREEPAVREGVVAAVMAGFVVFVVVAAIGLSFFYKTLAHDAAFVPVQEFPAPRLQTLSDGVRDPEISKQQADLQHFRWIDRAHGVFQIPIERAMRLVAARGPKALDPIAPQTQAAPRPAPQGTTP
ncbi:MAG TPA: hypothetical protein VMH79_03620 [Thermoanaerobaculia bacterium]|nr:hypothetical protein [Thermoanaerobaculia bacterium]